MLFDDIESGDAVWITNPAGGQPTNIAVQAIGNPIKEKDGMVTVAWNSNNGALITAQNFKGFVEVN
jgi:hypothetical protein